MRKIVSFLVGSLFGTGLLVSGMTDTRKVQGWLDVFGDWDPTLAFVMGGAILPMAIAWRIAARGTPRFAAAYPAAPKAEVGPNLVIGSVLFGVGWGLVGLCPGPAMASLTFGGWGGLAFAGSMALGMALAPMAKARLDALPAPV